MSSKEIIISKSNVSLKEKLEGLPTEPGIYQFKDIKGYIIYIGKARNLRSRVRQYFQKSHSIHPKTERMISQVSDFNIIVTDNEIEALILESNLIKKINPRYNILLKDDKSFPYIVITNESYPRIFVTRRVVKDGSKYFGPYTNATGMRLALKAIRDIFQIRSCNYELNEESIKLKKYKICLDYHIKKCGGPCEGRISESDYIASIQQASQALKGRTDKVESILKSEMERLSNEMRFEEATLIRDRIRALAVYSEKQKMANADDTDRDIIASVMKGDDAAGVILKVRSGKVIGTRHFYLQNVEDRSTSDILETIIEQYYLDEEDIAPEILLSDSIESSELLKEWLKKKSDVKVEFETPKSGDKFKLVSMVKHNAQFLLDGIELQRLKRGEFVPNSVKALQRDLRLQSPPRRIECFDISNIQGSDTVASMVVFVEGKMKKSEYRKFQIRTVKGPDDYASIREVIERRYKKALDEKSTLPDLIVIDGGKGQLSTSFEVINQLGLGKIPMIGLTKRLEEIFIPTESDSILLPKTSSGLRLLQHIRNEAHRFAVTYHRKLRSKRILQTELDLINGIGKKRAKELLEAFGSVQGVKFATEEQLSEIVGLKVASKIKDYFEFDS